jgi:hypothetical protein
MVSELIVALRGFEDHIDHAVHMAIRGLQGSDIDAQAARDGGSNLGGVEVFTFDFAAFENVFGDGLENRGLAEDRNPEPPCGRSSYPAGSGPRPGGRPTPSGSSGFWANRGVHGYT